MYIIFRLLLHLMTLAALSWQWLLITPDKALPLFSDKRPFTANNPMNGGLPSATSSNLGAG
jgi:hypothetical protein